jgi:predicted phage tail component-like protein
MVLMTYNGKDLSELVTIQEVLRNVGNERSVTTDDSPSLGVNITQLKTSAKIISVSFYMKNKFNKYALNQDKHTLAGILNVDEPVKITFDDEPDKYYIGYVQGLPDIEDPIAWLSVLKMELIIPDGVAHSTTYKSFSDYTFETPDVNIDNGTQLLNNAAGPFEPKITHDVNPSDNFDNYEYYYTTNIQMTRDKTYALQAKTNGVFSGHHDVETESDRVLIWLARYEGGKLTGDHRIISDENTGTQTNFKWNLPTGNYVLRINSYHRTDELLKKAWDVKIVETGGTVNLIKMDVDNKGNVDAKPIITIKSTAENGYYGIVNKNGVSSVGNPEESDGKIVENQEVEMNYNLSYWKGANILQNPSGPFEPNSNPINDYNNVGIYKETKVYLKSGQWYSLKARTDGNFHWEHNGGVESDKVLLWFANESGTVNQIVSDSATANESRFLWGHEDGYYYLRVNTYHKYASHSVSDIEVRTFFGDNNKFLEYALSDARINQAVVNDKASDLTWTSSYVLGLWGRQHLAHKPSNELSTYFGISSLTYDVTPTQYEYFWWRQIFWCENPNHCGILKIIFSDDDDNWLYIIETDKRSSSFDSNFNLLVTDNKGGYKMAKNFKFNSINTLSENPFYQDGGWCDVIREDSKIQLYWYGSRYTVEVPELHERRTTKIHFVWQSVRQKDFVAYAYIDAFKYINNKGTLIQDVPNRYHAGTELVLNSENKTIQLDRIYDISQKNVGSDFITIPPGESQLEFYTSSWSNDLPDIEVKFEERYI